MSGAFARHRTMTTTKFLHTSDAQIGMTRSFLDPDAQARFDDARITAIHRIGEIAAEQGCEFIVMAGDTFEYNSVSARTRGRAVDALRSLPVPTYILPGNHDPLVAGSIVAGIVAEVGAPLHCVADSDPVEVKPGVYVVGAPLLARHAADDLVARAVSDLAPSSDIRIVLGHGQAVRFGEEQTADYIDVAALEAPLRAGAFDYVALGDSHSTADVSESGAVWFSGAPETTDYMDPDARSGEIDSGNVLVVEVEKDGVRQAAVSVEKLPVGVWIFEALTRDINSESDVDSFLDELRAYENKERTVIKYALHGTVNVAEMHKLEAGLESLSPIFAALYPRQRLMQLHLEPGDEDLENLGLKGFAADALNELIEAGETDAVNLLFRLGSAVKA
ncbi:exonuclease SbcD family protein [Corynebacterium renale]|uniref:Nuclease SbcCD subunit D n=2 Tax=Corynebacterium renale TaxID=1724 RepID=A0A2A9DQA5_9CORY|nr:DNA repair exonuclease SbcCD nuclease subunit [Corynebacterium renale]SQI25534.1 exonuclease SbcD family protein [Corynebacterium renale]